MKSVNQSLPNVLQLLAAVSVLGLTACEQKYVVKTSPGKIVQAIPEPPSNTSKNTDGSTTTVNPDGSTTTISPDGTITVTQSDGTITITLPNGTVTTRKPDGTVITQNPDGTKVTMKPDGSTFTQNPDGSTRAMESFAAASKQTKKIDFLFVIDNSGSMSDNQRKLASGFKAFANTFYRRSDLDICTLIITSDRYLGREDGRGYQRERALPCTKPAGSENWSAEQTQAHLDALIADFQNKVYVGTRGSGTELLGKSVVSFLYGLDQWGDSTEHSTQTAFFRKDAVANISFVTDENNYFFNDPSIAEVQNDLPYASGIAIPGAKNDGHDTRKGMKEYLDQYFSQLNPARPASYSTTSILELSKPANMLPGIATNLNQLPKAVGRESTQGDISGPAQAYTDVYQSVADAIVLRATTFTLAHPSTGEIKVVLRRANGQGVNLTASTDFSMHAPSVLSLSPGVLPKLQSGDRIEVLYSFVKE